MKIMKKIVSTSCIFLFASVDMWTKRCLSILCFLFVMYSSQFWQKSVDRWTNNENYEKKNSISFILFLESANLWTSSCHSILFLLSTIQNFDQKMWTGEKKWKFLKKNSFNFMYIFICKCGYADKKVSFYHMFSFCYVLFTILTKKCGQVDQ